MTAETLTLPVRHDMIRITHNDKDYCGEVRRVYEKPKGHLVVVKLDWNGTNKVENQYRSFYLEQCDSYKIFKY